MKELFEAMYDELPAPKPKRRNKAMLPTCKSGSGVDFIEKKFADYVICAKKKSLPERAGRDNICCSFQAFDSTAIYLSIKLLTFASYAAESVG